MGKWDSLSYLGVGDYSYYLLWVQLWWNKFRDKISDRGQFRVHIIQVNRLNGDFLNEWERWNRNRKQRWGYRGRVMWGKRWEDLWPIGSESCWWVGHIIRDESWRLWTCIDSAKLSITASSPTKNASKDLFKRTRSSQSCFSYLVHWAFPSWGYHVPVCRSVNWPHTQSVNITTIRLL